LDESDVKSKVFEIARKTLGEEHLATQIAVDARVFYQDLAYPGVSWKSDDEGLKLVAGFDRSSVTYIALDLAEKLKRERVVKYFESKLTARRSKTTTIYQM
jgi:hypothetical protein